MTREDSVIGFGLHAIHKEELSTRLKPERTPPTKILDTITSVTNGEYGCTSPEIFLDNFVSRIIENPDDPHFLFAGGESGNGKSRLLEEMMVKILLSDKKNIRTRTRLAQFAKDRGMEIRLHSVPWGDASEHLPLEWMIDKDANYHDDPVLHAGKQREVNHAEEIIEATIDEEIDECNMKPRGEFIDIYIGDVPINSGDEIDGVPVGILRAYNLMKDLRHKRGKYRGKKFQFSFIMLNACTAVRNEAFSDRSIITNEDLTEKQRRKALRKKGKKFVDPTQSVKEAAQEPATPDQMSKLEQDTNDVLIALYPLANTKTRPDNRYDDEITAEMLKAQPDHLRIPMVGEIQNTHILRDVLQMPPNSRRVANFFNGEVVENVQTYKQLKMNRPIAKRRPHIIEAIKTLEEAM